MLGYTGFPWLSVRVPEMPPRKALQPLAGNYGRIPVGQLGADIFCDTSIIADEIADLADNHQLSYSKSDPTIAEFSETVEAEVFFPCVVAGSSKALSAKARKMMSLWQLTKLVVDRINMKRHAKVPIVGNKDAWIQVKAHLEKLENHIDKAYLVAAEPTIADFAAYHPLWFLRDLGERSIVAKYQKVNAWMDRMKAFGHGNEQAVEPVEAWSNARNAEPRPVPAEFQKGQYLNKTVEITPNDYRLVPTRGILAGESARRWILAREHGKCGKVHVHFPKSGYTLSGV